MGRKPKQITEGLSETQSTPMDEKGAIPDSSIPTENKTDETPLRVQKLRANLEKAREALKKQTSEKRALEAKRKQIIATEKEAERKALEVAELSLMERVKKLEAMLEAQKQKASAPAPPSKKSIPPRVAMPEDSDSDDSDTEYQAALLEAQKKKLERKAKKSAEKLKNQSATEILRRQIENMRDDHIKSWLLS